jgi:hypothetical protein
MVSSKLVDALTCGPNRAPIDSRNDTSSPGLKLRLPLKAMCSRKWARPRWSFSSWIEPASTASRIDTRLAGRPFWRMKYFSPFGSWPDRTAGSIGRARSSASSGGACVVCARGIPASATTRPMTTTHIDRTLMISPL